MSDRMAEVGSGPRLSSVTLYVSPDGNDTWSGTRPRPTRFGADGPLASLKGARDALRRLKALGRLTQPAHVIIAGGTYPLREPVVFGPQDSGSPDAPIVSQVLAGGARHLHRDRSPRG